MNGRYPLLATLLSLLAVLLLLLHFTGVIRMPETGSSEPPPPDLSSKRFDRITLYNLSKTEDITVATVDLYRRMDPAAIWRTFQLSADPDGMDGRVLNLTSEDPLEHIVKVTCTFTVGGVNHSVQVVAEAAILTGDLAEPALNSATFWFGPEDDVEGAPHQLCGEGVLGDHTTWVDYRP